MFCSKCGNELQTESRFCQKCGQPVDPRNIQLKPMVQSPAAPIPQDAGRGGLILALGIVAIAFLGPFTGIPAWIMGHADLKKIRAGMIAISAKGLTTTGMVLGIVGTFFSIGFIIIIGIAIAVGISQFGAHSTQANKDGVTSSLVNIAANAYQFKIRPTSMNGGGGNYSGYVIPSKMQKDDNGTYTAGIVVMGQISIIGTSTINTNWWARCTVDNSGKTTITYNGW